jgi:hypothetical protein
MEGTLTTTAAPAPPPRTFLQVDYDRHITQAADLEELACAIALFYTLSATDPLNLGGDWVANEDKQKFGRL